MLGINNIEDFVFKLGLTESDFKLTSKDAFGDLLISFDPDIDFPVVRSAIMKNRGCRNNIVDSGINYCELNDTLYVDGNRVVVSILCETGDSGVGTVIKFMVKRVEYAIDGEIKSFLSFESLKNYLNRMIVQS